MKQEHKSDSLYFHLYKILGISSKPVVTRSRPVFDWDWGCEEGQTAKGATNLLDEVELASVLIVAVPLCGIHPR